MTKTLGNTIIIEKSIYTLRLCFILLKSHILISKYETHSTRNGTHFTNLTDKTDVEMKT